MKTGKRPRDDKKRGKEEDEVEEKLIAKKVSKVSVASIASAASAAGATLSKKALSTLKKTGRLPTSVPGRAAKAAEALQPCKTDPKKTEALMVSARKMFERTHFTLSDMLNPVHSAFKSDLKDRWMTMPKEERSVIIEADKRALSLRAQAAAAPWVPQKGMQAVCGRARAGRTAAGGRAQARSTRGPRHVSVV